MAEVDLLSIDKGTVSAPAGYGKTQLICTALQRHAGKKPVLILTHTNAGVTALRARLKNASVSDDMYRLSTLDGWSLRLASTFPARSGYLAHQSTGSHEINYEEVRSCAAALLRSGNVHDLVSASYSRLFVDEYQDCSVVQHEIVAEISTVLPTCVLGDRLQAIFGFGGTKLVNWDADVCSTFPLAGELDTPWRWKRAGSDELGEWLRDVRQRLLTEQPILLSDAPSMVKLMCAEGKHDLPSQLKAAREPAPHWTHRVMVIANSDQPQRRRTIASRTPGATTIESVELTDLMEFASKFEFKSPTSLADLVSFAASVMTNVGEAKLLQRVKVISAGRAKQPPTAIETAALAFTDNKDAQTALRLLDEIRVGPSVRLYRPAILSAARDALLLAQGTALPEAVAKVRELARFTGRKLAKRSVGSTLLLKGLEAEMAIVLDADALDTRNLYVALTRASKRIVVCATDSQLNPAQ